jgi:hypothetical protein
MQNTYRLRMAVSKDVAYARFAAWVKAALAAARTNGMTDLDIHAATAVTPPTFHRWQRGDFGKNGPQPEKVMMFCDGLGLSRKVAADMLGWSSDVAVVPVEQPELPPDIREILRKLRDPNVSTEEKYLIRETIRSLAARPKPTVGGPPRGGKGGDRGSEGAP